MNILGFNPSHHGSVCLLKDGEIEYFIQEERSTRKKYDAHPFHSFINAFQNHKIDIITWATPSVYYPLDGFSPEDSLPYWVKIAQTFRPKIKIKDFSENHHLCHVAHSFYNSGFKECIGIVIDGMGSTKSEEIVNKKGDIRYRETESIYYCSYPSNFKFLYKGITNVQERVNLSRVYETVTMHLGWNRDEAGKTMGLAPYGKYNSNLPSFFTDKAGNPNTFICNSLKPAQWIKDYPQETFMDEEKNPQLKLSKNPKKWHHDKSKITDLEKDIAWKVQNDTQQLVGDYIEKSIKETGLKQVCCAGGYFLNCVTNYYLLKRFPDIEFYFEPISNDSGIAIGAAKLLWYALKEDTTIRPFKSLYLGSKYPKEELLKGIKKYVDN